MASDLLSFKIATNAVAPQAQLTFPETFGATRLAKRMKLAVGKAKLPQVIELLRGRMREMSVAQRRGLLVDRSAKAVANHPGDYLDLARATGLAFAEGQRITPAFLDALQESLARVDGPALAELLERRWLYSTLYINTEIWTLHMLLHEIEGDALPRPATARLRLDVECVHPDASLPTSADENSIRALALRLLGFLRYGGPIDAQLAGAAVVEALTIPFKVAVTDRTARSASIHVLTSREAAAPYPEGLAARSTAW